LVESFLKTRRRPSGPLGVTQVSEGFWGSIQGVVKFAVKLDTGSRATLAIPVTYWVTEVFFLPSGTHNVGGAALSVVGSIQDGKRTFRR
jgi:hypothetical protein